VCACGCRETSFENAAHETSPAVCQTVSSQELHNDLTHYYNVPGVSVYSRSLACSTCQIASCVRSAQSFYPCDAMLARVLAMALCLSVSMSVTSRCSVETDELIGLVLAWELPMLSYTVL